MLSIFEELFLLALDSEEGNILPFAKKYLAHGLSGGILAELILQGRINSNEKHRLELLDASPTGDQNLDQALQEIQAAEKPRKLSFWVSQLSERPKKLRELIGEGLVAKELLTQEEGRFYWRTAPSEGNAWVPASKFEMKNPLRASILATGEVDPHTLALLNVASGAGLLGLIFTQDELPMARQLIHEHVVRAALKYPLMQTVEEIEQAIATSLENDLE